MVARWSGPNQALEFVWQTACRQWQCICLFFVVKRTKNELQVLKTLPWFMLCSIRQQCWMHEIRNSCRDVPCDAEQRRRQQSTNVRLLQSADDIDNMRDDRTCDDSVDRWTQTSSGDGTRAGAAAPMMKDGPVRLHWTPECGGYRPLTGPEALSGRYYPSGYHYEH